MKITYLLLSVAPFAILSPVHAETASAAGAGAQRDNVTATRPNSEDTVSTGVARARDRLDSATSTSSLKEAEITKIGARSLGEVFRDIPGMRAAAAGGEGNASISIRGLPLALGGAKFLQIQEDGLPTLEFGDIAFATSDTFLRADLNLASIESIRGGSASTFASNSPGGIINLISKTGETEGGALQTTVGLDYGEYRGDFDYGAKLSDTLRFHVGGFYRQGEGPRAVGYDAFKGGQIKLNVTKTFDGGYIRFYGKYLDDRTPYYATAPVAITGTNDKPGYQTLSNFDVRGDTMLSRNFQSNLTLDENNNVARHDLTEGQHALVKSFGVETQFEVSDWTITERFRFSNISGSAYQPGILAVPGGSVGPAQAFANQLLGGAQAVLTYATGPNAGQVIANPAALNGNGLLARMTNQDVQLNNLNYVVNDIRASRVWNVGDGDLTTTVGFYKSNQTINTLWSWTSTLMEVRGDGQANLINIAPASNPTALVTQNGYYGYGASFIGNRRRSLTDMEYGVNAPYGSFNYHVGKISVGGSIRYDYGTARGTIYSSDLNALDGGTRVGVISRDINGDGVISAAENRVQSLPLTQGAPVNYNYHYVSYSTGINYRVSEPFAVFARYSRGARANADRILFSNYINPRSGYLTRSDAAYDPVTQAEVGVKYRKDGLTLNVTGFWAKTKEHNIDLDRSYRAYGAEFEGGYRYGPWGITAGATYTHAEITRDALVPSNVGHTPKQQPDLIFQTTPQYNSERFSIGAVVIGTTGSYAADVNQLKMPGFTTVNPFVQFRPVDRVQLSVNCNNLFNTLGLVEVDQAAVPASGVGTVRAINGRTVSASARFSF